MKQWNKLLTLFLSLTMLVSLSVPAGAAAWTHTDSKGPDSTHDAPAEVSAKTEVKLDGEKNHVGTSETNLGDLIADAMIWQVNSMDKSVDAAIINGGSLHASIPVGEISKEDITSVLPSGGTLYTVEITGAKLAEALEASTYCTPKAFSGFPQVSGMTFTINTGAPFRSSVKYPNTTFGKPNAVNRIMIHTIGGKAFNPDEVYTIATNSFLAAGSDTYYAFSQASKRINLGLGLDDVVMNYITSGLKGVVSASDYSSPTGRISTISYRDVVASDWYSTAVTYVTLTHLMNGTGNGFSPNATLTRAMMATTLYRMAGEPPISGKNVFQDVPSNMWYTNAVIWASENKITTGITPTTFSPNAGLTREQLATFFYRFASYDGFEGIDVNGSYLTAFPDSGSISPYAKEAVNWAVAEGLISGMDDGTLSPKTTATRAQVATILMRYTEE